MIENDVPFNVISEYIKTLLLSFEIEQFTNTESSVRLKCREIHSIYFSRKHTYNSATCKSLLQNVVKVNPLNQWFSTFLSLRHTNFVQKFRGTPKWNKRTKIKKIMTFSAYYVWYLWFGGTLRWIWRHTCASRHTGWETLL